MLHRSTLSTNVVDIVIVLGVLLFVVWIATQNGCAANSQQQLSPRQTDRVSVQPSPPPTTDPDQIICGTCGIRRACENCGLCRVCQTYVGGVEAEASSKPSFRRKRCRNGACRLDRTQYIGSMEPTTIELFGKNSYGTLVNRDRLQIVQGGSAYPFVY